MRLSFSRALKTAVCLALAGAALGWGGSLPIPAQAQSAGCRDLQAQIAALSRGDPRRASTYGRAAQKQRGELDRTTAYANSQGCQKRQFLIFGQGPPAQCGPIEAQIARMRANLSQLEAQANEASSGDPGAIRALTYRYNNECRAAPQVAAVPQQPRGFFEQLFGARPVPASTPPAPFEPALDPALRRVPLEPVQSPLEEDDEPATHRGGAKAVCVRACDGGFFPVSYSARGGNMGQLADLCHALCPNAEVSLYTYRTSGEIDEAVSQDGDNYTDLPNAFKYRKSFDPTCACKPPGQSWAQTLAEAEKVLGRESRNDILVTEKKADELSRPKLDSRKTPPASAPAQPAAVIDDASAREAAIAGRAANIISNPTGIAASDGAKAKVLGEGQGQVREINGPDGGKRRVRVIGLSPTQ